MYGTMPCAFVYLQIMLQPRFYKQFPFGGLNPIETGAFLCKDRYVGGCLLLWVVVKNWK